MTRRVLTSLCVLMAVALLPASAQALKRGPSIALPQTSSGISTAFDEEFLYWTSRVTPTDGNLLYGQDTAVMRSSLAGGPAVEIFRTRAFDSDFVSSLKAGGGYVAVGIHRGASDVFGDGSTRVLRFKRDGTEQVELSSGAFRWDRDQFIDGDKLDCGSVTLLEDVGDDGSVILTLNQRLRKTPPCSDAANRNQWQYLRVFPDGKRIQLLTSSAASTGYTDQTDIDAAEAPWECDCGDLGLLDLSIEGNWVLARSPRSLTLVNSINGKKRSGYVTGRHSPDTVFPYIDARGRMVVSSVRFTRRGSRSRAQFFPRALSLAHSDITGGAISRICAGRVLTIHQRGRVLSFVEHLGSRAKRIGRLRLGRYERFEGCNADGFVMLRPTGKRLIFSAVRF